MPKKIVWEKSQGEQTPSFGGRGLKVIDDLLINIKCTTYVHITVVWANVIVVITKYKCQLQMVLLIKTCFMILNRHIIVWYQKSYANETSAVNKILFITFRHKSHNTIDIQTESIICNMNSTLILPQIWICKNHH